jgi:hypothetical protein
MAEYYPDTVEVDGSSPSVITKLRLNSMAEIYYYKVEVKGSSPLVATNSLVAQLDRCTRLLTGGFWVRIPAGLPRMNGSTAEQLLVKQMVESSTLSSSAKCECANDGELGRLYPALGGTNTTTHTEVGENPVG